MKSIIYRGVGKMKNTLFIWMIMSNLLASWVLLHGESVVVDSPKEITMEWERKVLGIQYGVTDLANAVQEMTEGTNDLYFGKEFLNKIQEKMKKDPTGEYIEYWDNGKIKAKLPYKDCKADGHVHGWYEDGKDAFKGFFKEGVKQGIHITFYPPGVTGYPSDARVLLFNDRGALDGRQITRHPNGMLWVSIDYKDGKAQGILKCFHSADLYHIKLKGDIAVSYKEGKLQEGQLASI